MFQLVHDEFAPAELPATPRKVGIVRQSRECNALLNHLTRLATANHQPCVTPPGLQRLARVCRSRRPTFAAAAADVAAS